MQSIRLNSRDGVVGGAARLALCTCVPLLVATSYGWAGVPLPDAVFYGAVSISGMPKTAADDVTVSAKVANPDNGGAVQVIARYKLGADPTLGDNYALRVRLESGIDGSQQGPKSARVGHTVELFAQEGAGAETSMGTVVVSSAGSVAKVDLPFAGVPPTMISVCPSLGADAKPDSYVSPRSKQASFDSVIIQVSTDVTLKTPTSWCTTATGGTAPAVTGFESVPVDPDFVGPPLPGLHEVSFDASIPLSEWTTVVLTVIDGLGVEADLCFQLARQPGDLNQDGQTSLADATQFGIEFNGQKRVKVADLNNDGQVSLADATMFGQISTGSGGEGKNPDGTGAWLGQGIPPRPACHCP